MVCILSIPTTYISRQVAHLAIVLDKTGYCTDRVEGQLVACA